MKDMSEKPALAGGDEWVQPLASAVVEEAAQCYKAAKKFETRCPEIAKIVTDDCVEFFSSDWVNALTNVDGKRLLSMLESRDWSDADASLKDFLNLSVQFDAAKRVSVLKYYEKYVEPQMDGILEDIKSGMFSVQVESAHGMTHLRWSQCMKYVSGFKEKVLEARREGRAARSERGGEKKADVARILEENERDIVRRLEEGDTRTAVARDLKVSLYNLRKFLDSSPAAAGIVERGKLCAMKRQEREKLVQARQSDEFLEGEAAQDVKKDGEDDT